ncbi:SDR family NAD(P)-dependent oxidoreductase [Microbacterium sp. CPCC 204701]|uniref:SDR family NAD(P)-dependent oxidoreductase n=1 Tax=Microbacterium sp. CPCC 204701 TaxID=2493084 RepID=UPI000FD8A264|nr:SDR family NAD(P)-dependent oxidoreductase [Microbacterium sp. CPCC 204701]
MSGRLRGRVVVVTGAGRGIGREYALLAAEHGASVVVNDLGASLDGATVEDSPAAHVVDEIRAAGGRAVADGNDISDWEGAKALIDRAVSEFGDLHVLINNAGIMRDRMMFNMSVEEWDAVIAVNLRGHFAPTRHAAAYWREEEKAGRGADRVVISTSSVSGLRGSIGQVNYGTAKAGIATFAQLVDRELNEKYGVRSYAIAPGARTRLTLSTPHAAKTVGLAAPEGEWDSKSPANVAPFVIWLADAACPMPSGNVFGVAGGKVELYKTWSIAEQIDGEREWTLEELDEAVRPLLDAAPSRVRSVVEAAASGPRA